MHICAHSFSFSPGKTYLPVRNPHADQSVFFMTEWPQHSGHLETKVVQDRIRWKVFVFYSLPSFFSVYYVFPFPLFSTYEFGCMSECGAPWKHVTFIPRDPISTMEAGDISTIRRNRTAKAFSKKGGIWAAILDVISRWDAWVSIISVICGYLKVTFPSRALLEHCPLFYLSLRSPSINNLVLYTTFHMYWLRT